MRTPYASSSTCPLTRPPGIGHNGATPGTREADAAVVIFAYIDPSAGGMLMQLLLGGTAGVLVIGRLLWSRIRRLLGRPDPPDQSAPPAR